MTADGAGQAGEVRMPREASPFLSFLTTVYRTEEYLPAMIRSVQAQTCPDWELVVVDNGRSEDVAEIVAGYAGDRRIRLVRQENRGYRGGVTAAARVARGAYVSVLDSDDRVLPDFVATMLAVVRERPEVDAVGCDAVQFSEGDQAHLPMGYLESVGVARDRCSADRRLTVADVLSGVVPYYTGAVRREVWQAVGGYGGAEADVDESVVIWLELTRRFDVRLIPDRLGWYRVRADSLSREPARVEAFEEALIAAFTRTADASGTAADRRAADVSVSRLRYHQELRRARWSLLDGDAAGARRHARQAYAQRPGLRSALVVLSLAVSPTALRRVHPYKQRAAALCLRGRERLAGLLR